MASLGTTLGHSHSSTECDCWKLDHSQMKKHEPRYSAVQHNSAPSVVSVSRRKSIWAYQIPIVWVLIGIVLVGSSYLVAQKYQPIDVVEIPSNETQAATEGDLIEEVTTKNEAKDEDPKVDELEKQIVDDPKVDEKNVEESNVDEAEPQARSQAQESAKAEHVAQQSRLLFLFIDFFFFFCFLLISL